MREQILHKAVAAGPHAVNRMREMLQWEILAGLHRGEAFRQIAFLGGTCLRLLHGLQRFSEDLDFSLLPQGETQALEALPKRLHSHLAGCGFEDAELTTSGSATPLSTIWIKFPRILHEMKASPLPTQKLSIKIEIDCHPPNGAIVERCVRSTPSLMAIALHDMPTLMAGKLHAILARPYTKGRDWYDLLWYFGQKVKPNTVFLGSALGQRPSNHCQKGEDWRQGAIAAAEQCDWKAVVQDVRPFLENVAEAEFLNQETMHSALISA